MKLGQSVNLAGRRPLMDKHPPRTAADAAARYADLYELAPVGYFTLDRQGAITQANQAGARLLGLDAASLAGRSFGAFVAAADRPVFAAFLQGLFAGGASPSCELTLAREGPLPRIARLLATLSLDGEEGRLVVEDVTEHRRADLALADAAGRLQSLVEGAVDAVFQGDASGHFVAVNEQGSFLTGYAREELLAMEMADLFSPGELARLTLRYDALTDGKMITAERMLTRKDGTVVPVEMKSKRMSDGTYQSIVRDITERHRRQAATEKRLVALTCPQAGDAAVQFDELFDLADIQRIQDEFAAATGVASIITQPDGTPITKPSRFTRLCSEIVRRTARGCANCYKSDAILGAPHPGGPIVQPCLSGGLWDAGASITVGGHHIANWLIGQVRDATQTEEGMRAYAREIGADEAAFLAAFREVPAMSSERFRAVAQALFTLANQLSTAAYQNVRQARFINERQQAEEARFDLERKLQQAQKAESLGRMAGAIAHNFNNTLCALLGNLELAMNGLPQDSDAARNLLAARQAGRKASELSGLMLTYLGQTLGQHERLDLSAACRQTLPALQAAIPSGVDLKAELPSPGPVIWATAHQVQQILTYLATNAWEAFGGGRGGIRLAVTTVSPAAIPVMHRVPLDWQPQDTLHACLEVADAGCGIADTDIDAIFDPFFTTKFTGRGLGLSIVLGLVRAHGGGVTVESDAGRGSVFRVFWPVLVETGSRPV